MMSKLIFTFILFLWSFGMLQGQTRITGKITDTSGRAIVGANITISSKNYSVIQAFTTSNSEGNFEITSPNSSDSSLLKATYIGYATYARWIENKEQVLAIRMQSTEVKLKTVTVKNTPIYQLKDTLNYDVKAFSNGQDRTISDVLKKLPGVEVESSGRILYQGKPIQKLDINGMNLLEGKYSLATNNLPAEAVKNIQVIENDQPIKVLKDIVPSDRASINLQIKKFKTTGFVKAGVGASPFLWDVNASPISIFRNLQMLNTYQSNNTGNNVSNDLKNLSVGNNGFIFNLGDDFIDFEMPNANKLLSLRNPSLPPFNENTWLNNKIHLFSHHFLKKLVNGTELKANISYVNDHQLIRGTTSSVFNTPSNTIQLIEKLSNTSDLNNMLASVSIKKNKKDLFLENKLSAQKYFNNQQGLLTNPNTIIQRNKSQYFEINNQLKYVKKIKNNLYTFLSQVAITQSPQQLQINPGVYSSVLNQGNAYTSGQQDVQLNQFYANHSLGFVRQIGKISFVNKIAWQLQKNELLSDIALLQGNYQETRASQEFTNKTSLFQSDLSASVSTILRLRAAQLTISLPAYMSAFELSAQKNPHKWYLMPSISLKYEINSAFTLYASSAKTNTFGNIQQLYKSYILLDYRTLQKKSDILPESKSWNNTMYLTYKDPIRNVFGNISLRGTLGNSNLLTKYVIAPNGAFNIENLKINNPMNSASLSGELGRYFIALKTTLKFGAGVNWSKQRTWLEESVENISSMVSFYSVGINTTLQNWVVLQYNGRFTSSFSRLGERNLQRLKYQSHQINVTSLFSSKHSLMFGADYYTNNLNRVNQILFNVKYRWALTKSRIDIEFSCQNLLNTKQYVSVYNDSFTNIQNVFGLRPRQFLINLKKGF